MMYLLLVPFMAFAAEPPKVITFHLPKEVATKHKRRLKVKIPVIDIATSLRSPSPNRHLEFKAIEVGSEPKR